MALWRNLGILSIPVVSYLVLAQQLKQKYPNVPIDQMPKESLLSKHLSPPSNSYFAYCDIYKARVKSATIDELQSKFLSFKTIAPLLETGNNKILQTHIIETGRGENYKSVVIGWNWNPNYKVVETFEKLAQWGYPWRMMSGGIHEVLVVKPNNNDDYLEIYFSSAHEYRDFKDGKTIPKFTQNFHQTYARLVLFLSVDLKN